MELKSIPGSAKVFVALMALLAAGITAYSFRAKVPVEHLRFGVLLLLAIVASRMKLALPGTDSSMSMNLPFILIAIAELPFQEAIAVGGLSTFIQSLPKAGKEPKPIQILFNICSIINAIAIAWFAALRAMLIADGSLKVMLIVITAAGFFVADTVPVAAIICLTQKLRFTKVWQEIVSLSFPYFVLSAGAATIVATASHYAGWKAPLLLLPIMYLVYRSFRVYFGRRVALTRTVLVGVDRNLIQSELSSVETV